jgi:hypothetical protein
MLLSLDNITFFHNPIPAIYVLLVFLINLLWLLKDLYQYHLHNPSSDLIFKALLIRPEELFPSAVW